MRDVFQNCNLEIAVFIVGTCKSVPAVELPLGGGVKTQLSLLITSFFFIYGNFKVVLSGSMSHLMS